MIEQFTKRSISLLLALVMVFSMVPVQAFAMETDHVHEGTEEHAPLTAIAVTTVPAKTEYAQNTETLDVTGGVITLTYGDGCTAQVAMTADMVSGFDNSVAGAQTLTVTYGGLTATFNVTVVAPVAPASEVEPEVTEPVVTEPVVTEPVVTEPVVTEPVVTEPVVTEPVVTEPVATEPAVTEPVASEPTAPAEEGPSALALDLTARINTILEFYGITAGMTDLEINRAIEDKGWSVNKPNIAVINAIEADAETVTEEEAEYVLANADVELFAQFLGVWKPKYAPVKASSGTYTPVTGVKVGVSGATNVSESGGNITVTAKGKKGIISYLSSSKTATITIYNETENTANISFTWTGTNVHSLTVAGESKATSSGSANVKLNAGGSVVVKLTTDKNDTLNTLVLSGFSITEVVEADINFCFDSSLGSITVAGEAVANNTTKKISADGAVLAATPNSGAAFLGWIDGNNKLVSQAASFTLNPETGMTQVSAVFATTSPWFLVDGGFLYEGLDAATEKAQSTIVLMNNATLPAGDYTINSGVTLLIPFDATNTVSYETPVCVMSSTKWAPPTAYRTLTMASGANIVVASGGHMVVNGSQYAGGKPCGSPTGPQGFVNMASGSSITVQSGGNLYAWGYVVGSGDVTVKSGGWVYESFQVTDWRGGNGTVEIINDYTDDYRFFPFSQYYVQNVQVPMKLEAGSVEKGYMAVTVDIKISVVVNGSAVPFIGDGGMFNITSGYIIKDYDESADRLVITVDGQLEMKPLTISMDVSGMGETTINSSKYDLPLNSNMTVNILSGNLTLNQNVALLPGVELTVGEGATCTLAEGVKVFAYDKDQWGGYVSDQNLQIWPIQYAYGMGTTRTADSLVDAKIQVDGTVDASKGHLYSTVSGANVTSSANGKIILKAADPSVKTYQTKQTYISSWQGSDFDFNEKNGGIPITSVMLKNADGTFRETTGVSEAVTFQYTDGAWVANCEHTYATIAAVAPTCIAAGSTEGESCSRCGDVKTAVKEVAALGHAPGAAATCTTNQTCTRCGIELAPELGHTMTSVAGVEATCTTAGVEENHKCSRCNKYFKDSQGQTPHEEGKTDFTIKALGHNFTEGSKIAAVPATCTEAGNNEYHRCIRCDLYFKADKTTQTTPEDEVIAALGHNITLTVEAKEPTCTEPGTNGYVYCERCGKYFTAAVDGAETTPAAQAIAALGHDVTEKPYVAPKCEQSGTQAHYTCSRCPGKFFVKEGDNSYKEVKGEALIIAQLGHQAGAAATCDAAQTCTRCTYVFVPALGHEATLVALQPETCTTDGFKEHYTCSRCPGKFFVAEGDGYKEVSAEELGIPATHIPGDPATCTTAQTCTRCDYVYENALGHNITETVAAKAATCTEPGTKGYVFCNRCEKYFTAAVNGTETTPEAQAINALDHQAGTAATCTTAQTCIRCDYVYKEAKGHTFDASKAVAAADPTCTEAGNLGSVYCSGCQKHFTDTTAKEEVKDLQTRVLPALNHKNKKYHEPVPANCNDDGTVAYYSCGDCNKNFANEACTEEITNLVDPATGHTPGTPASCTAAQTCQDCGAELKPKLPHTTRFIEAETPSCTEDGTIAYYTCSYCKQNFADEEGETVLESIVDPAMGHKTTKVDAKTVTCTEQGNILHYTCERCPGKYFADAKGEAELEAKDVFQSALGHNMTFHAADPASCTENGTLAHYTCSRCEGKYFADKDGKTVLESIVDPAKDHDYVNHDAQAQTCTETGWAAYQTCKRCDYNTQIVLPVLGHDMKGENVKTEAKDPTCTEPGNIEYYTCQRCQVKFADAEAKETAGQVVIPANGHTAKDSVPAKSATCTEDGNLRYYTCANCALCFKDNLLKNPYAEDEHIIPAEGHGNMVETPAAPATCEEDGTKGYFTCDKCECSYEEAEALNKTTPAWRKLDALKHDFTGWATVNEATCTADGLERRECQRDNCDKVEENVLESSGECEMEYQKTTDATCTEPPYAVYVCKWCETPLEIESGDALGHSKKHYEAVAATCEVDGKLEHYYCSRCEKYFEDEACTAELETIVVTAPGHIPGAAATCTTAQTCQNCDHVYEAAKGHDVTKHDAVAATCENDGSIEYYTCSRCTGKFFVKEGEAYTEIAEAELTVAALQHIPGDAATCTTAQVCTRENCGETLVPAKGHDVTEHEKVSATCTDIGMEAHYTCSRCPDKFFLADGESYKEVAEKTLIIDALQHIPGKDATCTEPQVCTRPECGVTLVPALDHAWIHDDEVPATCTKPGTTSGSHCDRCGITSDLTEIPATGHTMDKTAYKAPTCTEDGTNEYYTCSVCHNVYKDADGKDATEADKEILPATGHTPVQVEAEEVTCTADGIKEHYVCACGALFSDAAGEKPVKAEDVIIKSEGHKMDKTDAKDVTCTADGNIAYYTCSACENLFLDDKGEQPTDAQKVVIKSEGHKTDKTEAKDASCTEDGNIAYYTCSVCKELFLDAEGKNPTEAEDVVIPKGHEMAYTEAKDPSCKEAGNYAYYTCSVCGNLYEDEAGNSQTDLDAVTRKKLNHTLTTKVIKPACTEKGYTLASCKNCDYTTKTNYKDALGHDMTETVAQDASCTEDGTLGYFTCGRCSGIFEDENGTKTTTAEDRKLGALGHTAEKVEAQEAACGKTGNYEHYICTVCKALFEDADATIATTQDKVTIPALKHDLEVIAAKNPTCTEAGTYGYYQCSLCQGVFKDSFGEDRTTVEAEYREALGHNEVKTEAVAVTCTADGNVEYYTCETCKKLFLDAECTKETDTASVVIKHEGHKLEKTDKIDATCTTAGNIEYYTCGTCSKKFADKDGKTEVTDVVLPALGHAMTKTDRVDAICTADGNIEYYTCGTCSKKFADKDGKTEVTDVVLPALGHAMTKTDKVDATCTADGNIEYYTCGTCGKKFADKDGKTEVKDVVISQTGHKPGAAANCEDNQICTVCNEVLVTALGHRYVNHTAKAPTCTEGGWDAYRTCSRCDYNELAEKQKPALGHAMTKTDYKAPGCVVAGNIAYYTCGNCNKLFKDADGAEQTNAKDVILPAINHDMVKTEAKAATCMEDGTKGYFTCNNCGLIFKDEAGKTATTVEAEKIVHSGHSWKDATCTDPQTCSVCKATQGEALGHAEDGAPATCTTPKLCTRCKTHVVQAALGHDMTKIEAKEPGCETTGLKEHYKCSRCNTLFADEQGNTTTTIQRLTISATGHTAGAAATCVDDQICIKCSKVLVSAYGHTYIDQLAKAPTCTEVGWDAYKTCNDCDYTSKVEKPALGHDPIKVEAKPATCTADGNKEYYDCSRCDALFADEKAETAITAKDTVEVALDHKYVDHEAKAATCEEIGWHAYKTCERCDYTSYKEIAKLGHKETTIPAVAPTCENTGLAEGVKCSVCNKVLVEQAEVAALGHVEVIDNKKEPTCEDTGLTEGKHCDRCKKTLVEQEEIPATDHDLSDATCTEPATCQNKGCTYTEGDPLGHTVVIDEAEPAMCEDTGLTEGSHCSVCNEVLVAQEVLPKLGHDIWKYDAKKPTFTGPGWEAYEECSRCAYSTKVEIPALGERTIHDYETFVENLTILEELAHAYVLENPGKDPAALVIKYIRTGVERYNSGSWGIMAGYEDAGFAAYVSSFEDNYNVEIEDISQMLAVSSLKNVENFALPNGDIADLGHVFGMMDITYHNSFSKNHEDVAGWAGDTVDLLSLTDQFKVSGTLDEMVAEISANYLLKNEFPEKPIEGSFNLTDMRGDMDGFYIMQQLKAKGYENGTLTEILTGYFTEGLNDVSRADYFLQNRLNGVTLRSDVRKAVYNTYLNNPMIATLEATREFTSSDLDTLKKACCYAVADYLCRLAGDFVEVTENPYYDEFSSESSTLAPGITQDIKLAYTADGKQIAYYLATADVTREDVEIYANYNNSDPAAGWAMQRVLDQANAAQNKYGDPESEHYIPNYNVIASINGAGYNMQTGEPGGVLVMGGVEYHPIDANGFFGILKDGTPVIGTTAEYNTIYKGQIRDAIAGFGSTLVRDGKVCISATSDYYRDRASRTAIGITKTGKVVFMVLDGRQEPWSCGGSMQEIAQIMMEAGCVTAINLDGGGSTTYVAKPEGEETLQVVSRPSDGAARSVSTSLLMVSTAVSSTAFDHAILESDTNYMTVGSSQQIIAEGVSATGNPAELPEGTSWAVSDEKWGTITENGMFTALRNGDVEIYLMQGDAILGRKTMHVVVPNNVYFTKSKLDMVYGETVELPVKALYDGKAVTIRPEDLTITMDNPAAGTINGFQFTSKPDTGIRVTVISAKLAENETISANISIAMYNQGEASFDFEQATNGDRQMAWDRKVSNSVTADKTLYEIVEPGKDMVTSYIFAIDMTQIPIPPVLNDLIYMLPGSDMEGASAWTFLLQLAQRVSTLTEVRPTIHFDPNMDVDCSNITLVNEYFDLEKIDKDDETNTITLTLRWKKQTEPIDPAEANPMCIVSGIKLTPKANAAWTDKDTLTVVNSGEVGYNIYLRASSLYTFAQKPENQNKFGLLPFVNPDDPSEKGAGFADTYKEFVDTYTLSRKLKNGWQTENGGFAYYVDGVKLTGVKKVDGYYYDFGENGINNGQTKFTGLFWDSTVSAYRYSQIGELASGWKSINGEWYHFWKDNYCASVGRHNWTDVYYTFDKTGRLISGEWKKEAAGTKYFYGPTNYKKTWAVINGNEYYFDENGYRAENYQIVKDSWTNPNQMYQFTSDGILVEKLTMTGLLDTGDKLYYLIDGIAQYGLYFVEGYYYYFNSSFAAVTGTYYVTEPNGLMPKGNYLFDENHRMVVSGKNGLVQEYDGLYYYVNNSPVFAGLIKLDGYYYYIDSNCRAVSGKYYVSKTNDIMLQGEYEFDENCRMILNGLVKENGGLYYYENGKLKDAGLIMIDGSYYYINNRGLAVTGSYYIEKTNGIMAQGRYEFADDSTMILTGLVKENDGLFYYENNKRTYAGVIKIGEDYYYIESDGKAVAGTTHYVEKTNDLVPEGEYEFTDEGKMVYVPEPEPEPEEPEIPLFSFYAANVIMGNNLDMMFAFPKAAVADWTGHYVQIERTYTDGRDVHVQKIPYAEWSTNGNYYVVTYKGLAAKEMCDTITLTVYNAEDRAVSRPWVDSMRGYAMRMLDKTLGLQKTMFVDMLNYGAEAQNYFGYSTADLANSQLTEEQKAYASGEKTLVHTLDQGDKWKASNLILKSNIQFMVAFTGLTSDMSARVQFTGHKGNVVNRTVAGTEFGNNNGIRYVLIDDLVIADARQEITITIYNADGSVYTVCQESIQDYLARRSSVSSLFEAIMKFADSAYAYLHRND